MIPAGRWDRDTDPPAPGPPPTTAGPATWVVTGPAEEGPKAPRGCQRSPKALITVWVTPLPAASRTLARSDTKEARRGASSRNSPS